MLRSTDRNSTVIARCIMVVLCRIRPSTAFVGIAGLEHFGPAQPIASQRLGPQIRSRGTVTAKPLFAWLMASIGGLQGLMPSLGGLGYTDGPTDKSLAR